MINERDEEMLRVTTIPEFIDKGRRQVFVIDDASILEKIVDDDADIVISFDTLYAKYHRILVPFIKDFEFTDIELQTYKYQPKRFCLDIYNTTELWSALLYINNMISITEFKKKKIKVFAPQILDLLDDIYALVETDMVKNKDRVRYS